MTSQRNLKTAGSETNVWARLAHTVPAHESNDAK